MTHFSWDSREEDIQVLKGMTFTEVVHDDEDETLTFKNDEYTYVFGHSQDCCEHVYLESIDNDIQLLVGMEILEISERTQDIPLDKDGRYEGEYMDTLAQWTFYHIRTARDTFVIRWNGSSNGYYSVDVQLYCTESPPPPPEKCFACGGIGHYPSFMQATCDACKGTGLQA